MQAKSIKGKSADEIQSHIEAKQEASSFGTSCNPVFAGDFNPLKAM